MIYISHRGNINGPNKKRENSHDYLKETMKKGFNVEVDVHYKTNNFYLGHDRPKYKVKKKFLLNKKVWCHAKSILALKNLEKIKAHFFWHQKDDVTLTNRGYFWTYPGKKLTKKSICVLPEWQNNNKGKRPRVIIKFNCAGICSDYISDYKK